MAKVFLKANETFTISDDAEVIGLDGGSERILIAGAPDVDLDANVEAIDLAGTLAEYTFQVNGTEISIMSGTNHVATFAGLNQNCTVRFADGSADLVLTGMDVATLGGISLTTSATHLTPVLLNTTAGNMSLTAGTGTPQFNVIGGASVLEGSTATFTVTLSSAQAAATSVDYALTGTGGAVLGTDTGVAVPGNTGKLTFGAGETTKTITVPVTFDPTSEPGEGLLLTLSAPSTGTSLGVAPTAATVIADPVTPTFAITSNAVAGTPTLEGNTIVFTVTPSSVVVEDTTFNVNLIGSVVGGITSNASPTDFTPPAASITFKSGDTAAKTVSITVANDDVAESYEGYKAQLLDSKFVEIGSVTGLINDPPVVPTYDLTAAATSYNEGTAPVFNLVTTGLTDGTILNYTLTGITAADITGGLLTGTTTVTGNKATITLPVLVEDKSTGEGNETLSMTLTNGTTVVDTDSITVIDSSTAVIPTYDLTAAATSYNEGVAPVFNLVTTGLTDGTILNYTLSGITAADITGGLLTGTTTVTGNKATITLPVLVADASTGEGNETLTMTLINGTTTVDTDSTTVIDSSTAGPTTVPVTTGNTVATAYNALPTDVKFDFTNGNFTYNISGFNDGDILNILDTATTSITNNSGSDGVIDIFVSDSASGTIMNIHLTGIAAADDNSVWSVTTFNSVFNAGALG